MKNEVIKFLKEKKYVELLNLSSSKKKILSTLISLSYDKKALLSWRSIEAIGIITGEIAKSDPEAVRNIAGRLLWMIRDESGGIGWSAPEILGEIVRNNPSLCSDIATVIVSFHEEPPLCPGVLRAIGRIGKKNSEMIAFAIPVVLPYLKSPDQTIRGNAAWALGEIGVTGAVHVLEELRGNGGVVILYEDGELKRKKVGELASEAIRKLKS